jgi:hypothetical protein
LATQGPTVMKKPDASQSQPAAALISERIAELGDWRGETLESAFKALVRQAIALNSSGKSKPSKKAKS